MKLLPVLLPLIAALAPLSAADAAYPERRISLVVGSVAGSPTDLVARVLEPRLKEILGQTVLIENKSGANGIPAVEFVQRAPADGYTFLIAPAGTFTINPVIFAKSGGANVETLVPVSMIASSALSMSVRASLGVKSCPEMISEIRKNPGKFNMGAAAVGTLTNLSGQLLKQRAGLSFEIIPHNGANAGVTAVAGGHADFGIESLSVARPFIESGHIVMLATTGAKRDPDYPDVMTLNECGVPGDEIIGWIAISAPPETPADVVDIMQKAIARAVTHPDAIAGFKKIVFYPVASTPAAFAAQIRAESATFRQLLEAPNLAPK